MAFIDELLYRQFCDFIGDWPIQHVNFYAIIWNIMLELSYLALKVNGYIY